MNGRSADARDSMLSSNSGALVPYGPARPPVADKLNELYEFFAREFDDNGPHAEAMKVIKPIMASGAGYLLGKAIGAIFGEKQTIAYQFLLGSAILLGYSAPNRYTDTRIENNAELLGARIYELFALVCLYRSSYWGSRAYLDKHVSEGMSWVISDPIKSAEAADGVSLALAGASSLVLVPGAISLLVRTVQSKLQKREYDAGAQRSDTALISAGRTEVANTYFQINHFMCSELQPLSRQHQIGGITYNVLNAKKVVNRLKNLPALIGDAGQQAYGRLANEKKKIENDYRFNTTKHNVLRFTEDGPKFFATERYKLRTGDYVHCDENLDLTFLPISGEVVAFQRDEKGELTQKHQVKKFSLCLQANNGEPAWIEYKTKMNFAEMDEFKEMDLHKIHAGRQPGVLTGTRLNLYGGDNFFIRIKKEKEKQVHNDYEKQSVIDQIIAAHKFRNAKYSVIASAVMAGADSFLRSGWSSFPVLMIHYMYDLNQMLIQFAEPVLRGAINSRQMQEINRHLPENEKLSTMDALRVVDLLNMLAGYKPYIERFPKGIAIVSDKTGTLTTSQMNFLGLWTNEMSGDVTQLLKDEKESLRPSREKQLLAFEICASANTNSKKELEPEEFEMLRSFEKLPDKCEILKTETLGNNHFKKILSYNGKKKEIETLHIGLFGKLGGRLTLVEDGDKKYLVYCGVPKAEAFKDMPLLQAYQKMQMRRNVLSRDWAIARVEISNEQFDVLQAMYYNDKKDENGRKADILEYLFSHPKILGQLEHHGTFIIDNPVKKGANKFIANCRQANIPVFLATGDTRKSAENVAKVLCPEDAEHTVTITEADVSEFKIEELKPHTTVIFAGINDQLIEVFEALLKIPLAQRPTIIFSEMSTEGKGTLVKVLVKNSCFVVMNGDGTNDIGAMKNSHFNIGHVTEEGHLAPGLGDYVNLSDKQLQIILRTKELFYDSWDIHKPNSKVLEKFRALRNVQEHATVALTIKSSHKMGFEFAKAVGVSDVMEMPGQHWAGIIYDFLLMGLAYLTSNQLSDSPVENNYFDETTFAAYLSSMLQAAIVYASFGESTNPTVMLILLMSFIPTFVALLKLAFGRQQDVPIEELAGAKQPEPMPINAASSSSTASLEDGSQKDSMLKSHKDRFFKPASNEDQPAMDEHLKEGHGGKLASCIRCVD